MRTIGMAQKAIDMMCERALSRETQGSLLADKQFVQGYIADSYAQLVQFRLFVLYTAWEIDKYNDYKRVRKDIATAKVVMPTVLHDIAWRAMQVHGALGTTNEMPFFGMIHGAGVMGLADGPTEVHKVTVARQVLRDYKAERRHLADAVAAQAPGGGPGQVRRLPRAGGGEPVSTTEDARGRWPVGDVPTIADVDKLTAWLDTQGLGVGAPLEHHYISGGSQNEIYELRRGDLHCAMRIPPPSAPASRDEGIVREWRIIEALAGTDVPAHRGHRRVHRPGGARPHLLPDGLRRRLVAHVDPPPVAGALRHRPRATRADWPSSWSRASRCWARWTGRPRAWPTWAGPTASTSARSTAGPRSWSGSRGASCPGFDEAAAWLRAHRPIDYIPGLMHGDYQFANVMFKHGGPARLAAIVDWEMGTVGDPKLDLGWVVQSWPDDTSSDEDREGGYVDMTGMPSRDEVLAHYAKTSGRQVDDIDYYCVLAKWKLAVVLEQGFQRAGDDEKLMAFGPIVLDLMAGGGRAGRRRPTTRCSPPRAPTDRRARRAVPHLRRPRGRRDWRTCRCPRSGPARCGCASPSPR